MTKKLTIETLPQMGVNNHTTFEIYRADKVLVLYDYLNYKLFLTDDLKKKKWLNKNIKFLDSILNPEGELNFTTPDLAFFFRDFSKKKFEKGTQLGRLYNKNSIQFISKEIRSFLLKQDYIDFDIKTSHPTILFDYSKRNGLKLHGALEQYVIDKSQFFRLVKEEIKKESGYFFSDSALKKQILITLNTVSAPYETTKQKKFGLLDLLRKDFDIIRNHLWRSFCEGKFDDFEKAINYSIRKKEKKFSKAVKKKKFLVDDMKKVALQNYFCQNEETFHLKNFSSLLTEEYKKFLTVGKKDNFSDFYPYTSKKVDLPAIFTLTILPLFDGMLITCPEKTFLSKLDSIVYKFNLNSSVTFVKKEFEDQFEYLDGEEIKKFSILHSWLSKRRSEKILIDFLEDKGFKEKINKIFACELKEKPAFKGKQIKEEIRDKILILKNNTYNQLLNLNFQNMEQIEELIKKG